MCVCINTIRCQWERYLGVRRRPVGSHRIDFLILMASPYTGKNADRRIRRPQILGASGRTLSDDLQPRPARVAARMRTGVDIDILCQQVDRVFCMLETFSAVLLVNRAWSEVVISLRNQWVSKIHEMMLSVAPSSMPSNRRMAQLLHIDIPEKYLSSTPVLKPSEDEDAIDDPRMPSYTPSSPQYSPTSPIYHPTSPVWPPHVHFNL